MHAWRRLLILILIGLFPLGCGDSSHIKAKGRIIKGGQPYFVPEGSGFRVFFVPLDTPEGKHFDSFAAEYNSEDGSFRVQGKDGKGMPPGKYRVDLQLMKSKEDLLGGKLLGKKSPYVVEVTGNGDDLLIDLDTAHFDSLLAGEKPGKPKTKKG
ncbi:MAG TPA: hypothetical protein VGX70_07135 [Gemmataceae bacterium]|jgi:hypothetical protein|nr:hypothetical protein [Gemmataceae bacterium]